MPSELTLSLCRYNYFLSCLCSCAAFVSPLRRNERVWLTNGFCRFLTAWNFIIPAQTASSISDVVGLFLPFLPSFFFSCFHATPLAVSFITTHGPACLPPQWNLVTSGDNTDPGRSDRVALPICSRFQLPSLPHPFSCCDSLPLVLWHLERC